MKSIRWICPAALAACLCWALPVMAMGFIPPQDILEAQRVETPPPVDIDITAQLQKCLPHQSMPDEICYVSGGIGGDDVRDFKAQAKGYLLEIVFVQKADGNDNDRIEEYLASVGLQIKDSKGNEVVNITTEGPFFLADLPPGKYQITAEHDGVVKTDLVHIAIKKHQRTVFLWQR